MLAEALAKDPQPAANAALLARHGAVAVGGSLADAVNRLELVDVLCRVWMDAARLRPARTAGG